MVHGITLHCSYQGHTKNPSNGAIHKYQPKVLFGNIGLGFLLAGVAGVAGKRAKPCNHQFQQLQPTEIPALGSRRIRRASVFGSAAGIFGVALVLQKHLKQFDDRINLYLEVLMQSNGNFLGLQKLDWLVGTACFTWAFSFSVEKWRVDDWNLEGSNDRH